MERTEPKVMNYEGHGWGIISKDRKMAFNHYRDLSNCMGHIMDNAVAMTMNINTKDPSWVTHLDFFSKTLCEMYGASRIQLDGWITGFREIEKYIDNNKGASTVYATLCQFVVINMYAYLFTSVNLALNGGNSFGEELNALNFLMAAAMATRKGEKHLKKYLKEVSGTAPLISREVTKQISHESGIYFDKVSQEIERQMHSLQDETQTKQNVEVLSE